MNQRLGVALAAFVIWVAISVFGGRQLAGGEVSLVDMATRGIGWQWLLAAGFALAVVLWRGWNDVGLDRGAAPGTWRLAWLPMVYVVGALASAYSIGWPALAVLVPLLVNCLLVGFSEELMFRGAMLQAFRHTVAIWPAVLLTSIAFGSIHSLNVFMTGELRPALIQSSAAFLSGLAFVALRLRTGSLWPPIMVHAAWDFATFVLATAAGNTAAHGSLPVEARAPALPAGFAELGPVLLVLPNALYGLWLMRGVARTHAAPRS